MITAPVVQSTRTFYEVWVKWQPGEGPELWAVFDCFSDAAVFEYREKAKNPDILVRVRASAHSAKPPGVYVWGE